MKTFILKFIACLSLILAIITTNARAIEIRDCKGQINARLKQMNLGSIDKPTDGKSKIQFTPRTLDEISEKYSTLNKHERTLHGRIAESYSTASNDLKDSSLSQMEKNKIIVMQMLAESEHSREWKRWQTKKETSSYLPGVALQVEEALFAEKKINLDTGDFFGFRSNRLVELLFERAYSKLQQEKEKIYESYLLSEEDLHVLMSGEMYYGQEMIVFGRSEENTLKIFLQDSQILFFSVKQSGLINGFQTLTWMCNPSTIVP